jgi:hypothetical protein
MKTFDREHRAKMRAEFEKIGEHQVKERLRTGLYRGDSMRSAERWLKSKSRSGAWMIVLTLGGLLLAAVQLFHH